MTPLMAAENPIVRFIGKLRAVSHLIGAVLLQDMRTRFGASYLGYLIAIAWPLTHLCIITTLYYFRTMIAPVGDSTTMFIATGAIPYILCLYPARLVSLAIPQNKQLLNIPVLKPFHLIVSRSILEILNAVVVLAIFLFGLWMFDVDIVPNDLVEASKAVGSAIFLGVGLGVFNTAMCAIVGNYFLMAFSICIIVLYIFSGVYIPVWALPETAKEYMEYNPLFHIVEWLRSAYYSSYDMELVNKTLIFGVGGVALAIGLVGERFVRGKFFT